MTELQIVLHPHTWGNGWSYDIREGNTYYYDQNGHERCGADVGSEGRPRPCFNFPIVGSPRCSNHSAEKTLQPALGYIAQMFPVSQQMAIVQAHNPLHRDIGSDAALLEYRKAQLIQSLFSNPDLDFEALLKAHISLGAALSSADFPGALTYWQTMDSMLRAGQSVDETWERIYDVIERKRKIVQTESATMANSAKVVNADKVTMLLIRLMHSLLEINNYDDSMLRRRKLEDTIRVLIEEVS